MAKYRVKPGHGPHSRFENGARVTYQPGGEAFAPTKNELAQHGDKLEKVEPKKPQQPKQQSEANKGQGQQADADQGEGEQSGEDNKSSGSESGNTSGKQE